jgi:hypothetical protein
LQDSVEAKQSLMIQTAMILQSQRCRMSSLFCNSLRRRQAGDLGFVAEKLHDRRGNAIGREDAIGASQRPNDQSRSVFVIVACNNGKHRRRERSEVAAAGICVGEYKLRPHSR